MLSEEAIAYHAERIELARQNAALRAQVARLTADNEALQRTVAEKVAISGRLADALDERDGGAHDEDCKIHRPAMGLFSMPCNCGHDEAREALAAWEASK